MMEAKFMDEQPAQKRSAGDGGRMSSGTLERTAALVAVIVPLGLAISFAYDWGFFSALGLRFADAPTTIPDHLRTWLVWSPAIIPAVVAFLALELFTRRIEQGRTEDEIAALSPNPALTKRFRTLPWKLIRWMCVIFLVAWILVGYNLLFTLTVTMCWLWFMEWVFSHPRVLRRHSIWVVSFASFAPAALIIFFSLGYRSMDFGNGSSIAHVQVVENGVDSATSGRAVFMETHVMRSFGDWLLVRDASGTVLWVRSDRVDRIEVTRDKQSFRGVLCWLAEVCIEFGENGLSPPLEVDEMLTDTVRQVTRQ